MSLLRNQYTELVTQAKPLQNKIDAFKQYTIDNNLPFTLDYGIITKALKVNLFNELLKVNAGLAFEFNTMLKTEKAKADRIESQINLDGYEETAIIKQYLAGVKAGVDAFNSLDYTRRPMRLDYLFNQYSASVAEYYKSDVITFNGLEKEKKVAEDFVEVLNKILKWNGFTNASQAMMLLGNALTVETSGPFITKAAIDFNELHRLLTWLKNNNTDND